MKLLKMNKEFGEYWDREIKPLALKCCEGAELVGQLEKATTDAEKERIKRQIGSYGKKDWAAAMHISEMLSSVEHDLADVRNPLPRMLQVHGCLNSEDYYKDVFKGEDCEEAKNYRTLGEKLGEALKMLGYITEPIRKDENQTKL